MNGEEIEVKEASVGGVKSAGMLCDAPMLGWSGGGAGNAALVPDSFAPGDGAPNKRPRLYPLPSSFYLLFKIYAGSKAMAATRVLFA